METIHHVSLAVSDIKKAKQFYEEILGLEASGKRPAFDFDGAWYDIGGTQIHLIVSSHHKQYDPNFTTRDAHFAIRVKDLKPLMEKFKQANIKYIDNPTSITGWHQMFVQDPDGNVIEFHQV